MNPLTVSARLDVMRRITVGGSLLLLAAVGCSSGTTHAVAVSSLTKTQKLLVA